MANLRAEFTVEPFTTGAPGPHVDAALAAVRAAGLEPELGPFATSFSGAAAPVLAALRDVGAAAFAAGATRLSLTVEAEPDGTGA